MHLVQNICEYQNIPNKYINFNKNVENGLVLVKYSKRAFYDQAWNQFPLLCQARGHIFDAASGNIVGRPFDKVFNYGENAAGSTWSDEDYVFSRKKLNGFLGVLHHIGKNKIITTAGSFENDFTRMASEMIMQTEIYKNSVSGYTHMFEICHPDDPHIIPETIGAHFLGVRDVSSGFTHHYNSIVIKFGVVKEQVKTVNHEGFMITRYGYGQRPDEEIKIKSPYYLSRKFLARCQSIEKVQNLIMSGTLEEEIVALWDLLGKKMSYHEFFQFNDQDRLKIMSEISDASVIFN